VVLLIENDEADIFLFRRALAQLKFFGTVRVVGSVSEARDYLSGHGAFSDRAHFPVPDLIVSDMNLPGLTGNVFLEWLRAQPAFVHIPFVFLSGTFMPAEEARAHQLGVNSYFTKTGDMSVLVERLRNLLKFLPPVRNVPSADVATGAAESQPG
jgi:CheY-like chemotaxis protein